MDDQITNEKAKLSATLLNGLALAILVAGVVAPLTQWLGTQGGLATAVFGVLIASFIHVVARRVIGTGSRGLGGEGGEPRRRVERR